MKKEFPYIPLILKRIIKLLGGGGVKSFGLVLNGVVVQYGMIIVILIDNIVLEDFLLNILL